MTTPIDLSTASATELATALRTGAVRSVDATAHFLDRIARGNPRVRAVVHLHKDALRRAEEADRALAAGTPLGPLHGLPMTLKDGYPVGGSRSSFGLPHFRFHRPKADCKVIARLRQTGAVILGRTAVPFACFDWQCHPPLRAECVNPLDATRTPGGSSGGAAAALAAGFTPLEIGTDLAGSIRYPAHCCGVFGLRTTVGLFPSDDMNPEGGPLLPSSISVGPMARSPEDVALLLAALLPERDPREREPGARDSLRVAVTPAVPSMPVGAGTAAVVDQFVNRARAAGHAVEVLAAPPFDFDRAFELWGLLAGYELKQTFPRPLRARAFMAVFAGWFLDYRLGRGPLSTTFRRGMLASEAEYRAGRERQQALWAELDAFFDRFDVWALPVSPGPALVRQRMGRPIAHEGRNYPYSQYLGVYQSPTAVIGTPALAAPVGTDGGLPVGMQFHARRFTDRWLVGAVSRLLAGE